MKKNQYVFLAIASLAILFGLGLIYYPLHNKANAPISKGKLAPGVQSDCLRPELVGTTFDAASISSTQNPVLTPEKAGEALMANWLGAYVSAKACGDRKIGEFKIDSVQISEQQNNLAMGITYSVKPTSESKNYWLDGSGKLGNDGWIVGKFVNLKVKADGSVYIVVSSN